MTTEEFKNKTKGIIDDLKSVCADNGLGNDGNEFKIITQVFLYKFLNDKFAYEAKQVDKELAEAESWEEALKSYSADDYEMLLMQLPAGTAQLQPRHFLRSLYHQQNDAEFAKTFDDTLIDIATVNTDIFSVKTDTGAKVVLFDRISQNISDASKRDEFCRALVNKLIRFSFEPIFKEKYDFFATIFEYLISDYNKDSGGKYAEYYTPHAVAKIMASCLVNEPVQNVTCYDPSAGSGTLLMSLAHAIGEDKCTIYSQDISQKSSHLLRLNLILNNLVHSIQNIIQGNTIYDPYHKEANNQLSKFDYIVSNPPFKLDFSGWRDELDTKANQERFFAGLPNIPKKAKKKMAIYPLFIQHIMYSLSEKGKAAIVIPTGFITAQSGIEKRIRKKLVEEKMLAGVVSMPSNIFATTGTNVSILFIDVNNKKEVVLIDASSLGTTIKEDQNQKTILSKGEEDKIIATFNGKEAEDDFSVVVSYDEIKERNYSFSAGQYFEVRIEYEDINEFQFKDKLEYHKTVLTRLFKESAEMEKNILTNISHLEL
jgi:type I restriction enzyme M protein